jgi:hypothetical protein
MCGGVARRTGDVEHVGEPVVGCVWVFLVEGVEHLRVGGGGEAVDVGVGYQELIVVNLPQQQGAKG